LVHLHFDSSQCGNPRICRNWHPEIDHQAENRGSTPTKRIKEVSFGLVMLLGKKKSSDIWIGYPTISGCKKYTG